MSNTEKQPEPQSAFSLEALFNRNSGHAENKPSPANENSLDRKRLPPVSIRLNAEELERLRQNAAGMSLSGYIRVRLFNDPAPRKTRGKFPVKDHQALAKVLAALGRSDLASGFDKIAQGIGDGHVHLDPALEQDIRQTCADVAAMRSDLIRALGLSPE